MQTPPIVFEDYYLLVCNKPPGLSTEMQSGRNFQAEANIFCVQQTDWTGWLAVL